MIRTRRIAHEQPGTAQARDSYHLPAVRASGLPAVGRYERPGVLDTSLCARAHLSPNAGAPRPQRANRPEHQMISQGAPRVGYSRRAAGQLHRGQRFDRRDRSRRHRRHRHRSWNTTSGTVSRMCIRLRSCSPGQCEHQRLVGRCRAMCRGVSAAPAYRTHLGTT